MKEIVYGAGMVVFKEGDQAESFFQILEGTAGAYLNYGAEDERKLRDMEAGQFFGEMAVVEAWPRSATVVAETELKVLEIPENALNAYFTEQPDKILVLMKQIGARIRSLTRDYDEVRDFIREKDEAGEKKPEGFFAKLKKYRRDAAMLKLASVRSEESLLKMKYYGRTGDTGLPITSYRQGNIIFREEEIGIYMYMIQTGSVGIYTGYGTPNQVKLTTLYSDSFFGEMGMIEHEKRSATAVVEEDDTTLEIIRPEDLERLFKENPITVDMILVHLSSRLRRLTQDYVRACEEAVAGT